MLARSKGGTAAASLAMLDGGAMTGYAGFGPHSAAGATRERNNRAHFAGKERQWRVADYYTAVFPQASGSWSDSAAAR